MWTFPESDVILIYIEERPVIREELGYSSNVTFPESNLILSVKNTYFLFNIFLIYSEYVNGHVHIVIEKRSIF